MSPKIISQPIKILIVEDFHVETEALLRELIDSELNYVSEIVKTEAEYKIGLKTFKPDVILSPYSLATTNAVKLLSISRKQGVSAPFILLAYDLSEDIAIDLLGEGIEDYILRSTLKRLPVAIRKALQRYKIQLELQISEDRLRKSEISLQEAQKIAKVGSWEWEVGKEEVLCSDEMFRIYGCERVSFTLTAAREFIHPKDRARILGVINEGLANGILPVVEFAIITSDDKVKYVRAHSEAIRDASGSIIRVIGILQDVTERKKIELKLIRSQSLLSLGEEISGSGSFELDLTSRKTTWSANLYRIIGLSPETVITNKLFLSCVHPEDRKGYKEALAANIQSGIGKQFFYRIIRPDNGKVVNLQANGRRVEGENGDLRWIGSVLDITDKVATQQNLEAEKLQRDLILSTAKIGVWHWMVGSNKLVWDINCAQLFDEFRPELEAEEFYWLIHPDDRGYVQERLIDGLKTGEYSAEYRLIKNDTATYVLSRGRATIGKGGRATRIDGIIIDMTERHLLEAAQQQSEQLFRDMAENISEVFWLTDWELNKVLYVSPLYEKLYGQPVNTLYENPSSWVKPIHPEDKKWVREHFTLNAANGKYDIEYRLLMPDGKVKWVRDRAFPVFDKEGKVSRVAGITEEITERKNHEKQIKTLSLVASETSNGVLIHDAQGKIIWANQGFSNITGYSVEESLGKEPWSFLSGPRTDQKLVAEGYAMMKDGKTFYSENVLVDKNGNDVWISTAYNPIMNQYGGLQQIVSIGFDITKQKETESSQKDLLDELEKANQELRRRASN